MPEPIYPDKTKTGLAALKPLTDVFFAEPERWEWESLEREEWRKQEPDVVVNVVKDCPQLAQFQRLTPKPRRVWIGDQWYWEPLKAPEQNQLCWLAEISSGIALPVKYSPYTNHLTWRDNGVLFGSKEDAQQCLDAHRRARRVE